MSGRHRTGRHARRSPVEAGGATAWPGPPGAAVPAAVPAQPAPHRHAAPAFPAPAALGPYRSAVRLWFRDGSVLALPADDPLAAALRAAVEALLRP